MARDNVFLYKEKKNVLWILSSARKAIKEKDIFKLKELSNHTVHSASIYQDADSIAIAVLIYALSKTYEREKYVAYPDWGIFSRTCAENLEKAENCLKKDSIDEFRVYISNIRQGVNALSGHLRQYIEEVFKKAMINKASRIYEHGISQSKTAELLGISVWELAEYAGKTGIADVNLSITEDIKTRIERAMNLFK